jgi:hypothetical protein
MASSNNPSPPTEVHDTSLDPKMRRQQRFICYAARDKCVPFTQPKSCFFERVTPRSSACVMLLSGIFRVWINATLVREELAFHLHFFHA